MKEIGSTVLFNHYQWLHQQDFFKPLPFKPHSPKHDNAMMAMAPVAKTDYIDRVKTETLILMTCNAPINPTLAKMQLFAHLSNLIKVLKNILIQVFFG